ncbi:MAG: RNA polymerase subunit sigma-70 [Planctomycetes bacterium]|nr:RNA polymerase subunit sigma-70 [Planctomycetota bacterium]
MSDDRTENLLARLRRGDSSAEGELLARVYEQLRAMAVRAMRGERDDHTLQPTALVHEAYLRLVREDGLAVSDRGHFLRSAARAMRRILIEHARARAADKRGGERERVPLDEVLASYASSSIDVLTMDALLEQLAQRDPELVRLVEMRFFAGSTHEDIAEAMSISTREVDRRWALARAFLQRELSRGSHGERS